MSNEEDRTPLLASSDDLENSTDNPDASKDGGGDVVSTEEGGSTSGDDQLVSSEDDLTTVCETFWNICNTIQGLPILAIPYTFKSGGWYSLITLLIVAITSNYTSNILVKSLYEVRDGVKVRVRNSYLEIGEAFWKSGGKMLVLIVMVIELVFVSTMYPILVGAMFSKSFPAAGIPVWAWTLIGGIALLPNLSLIHISEPTRPY